MEAEEEKILIKDLERHIYLPLQVVRVRIFLLIKELLLLFLLIKEVLLLFVLPPTSPPRFPTALPICLEKKEQAGFRA